MSDYSPPPPVRAPTLAAQATVGALTAYSLVHLVLLLNDWWRVQTVERLQSGGTLATGEWAVHSARAYYFGIAHTLLALLSMVTVICWLFLARTNAETYHNLWFRLGRGWSIGGWFLPVVNLWYPCRFVREVVAASDPAREPGAEERIGKQGFVTLWWTAFLAMGAVQIVAAFATPFPTDAAAAQRAMAADFLLMPFWLVAAASLSMVVINVTNDQRERYQRGLRAYGVPGISG